MIKISKRYAVDIITWLDANVSPNDPGRMPQAERTQDSRLNPYSVSSTAMVAHWQGQDRSWHITQSARREYLEVRCLDPRIELYIATKWS